MSSSTSSMAAICFYNLEKSFFGRSLVMAGSSSLLFYAVRL